MDKQCTGNDYFKNANKIVDDIKRSHHQDRLFDAFVDFINQKILDRNDWTLWLSIHLDKIPTSDVVSIKKSFKYFLAHLNDESQTLYENYLNAFVFYEKNRYDHKIHLHALVDRIDACHLDLLQQR